MSKVILDFLIRLGVAVDPKGTFVLSYGVDRSMRMFKKSSNSDLYNCKVVSIF